jgi:pimeloyl-ACP methyl ester carboxylesterase
MAALGRALRAAGYTVHALGYPSRRGTIESHARDLARKLQAIGPTHLVAHSMGGLVARSMLAQFPDLPLQRVVMLGTPNNGSEVADFLHKKWIYQWLYGPSGGQLVTTLDRRELPCPPTLGVIAGSRAYDKVSGWIIGQPSDGKVSIASTRLEGMGDHLVLPVEHSGMLWSKAVHAATLRFLQNGRFS